MRALFLVPLLLVSCQTAKPQPTKPMFTGWEDATVLQMHQNCINTATEVQMPQPYATEFCNCMVGTLVTSGTNKDWEALSTQDKRAVSTAIGQMCIQKVFGEDETDSI